MPRARQARLGLKAIFIVLVALMVYWKLHDLLSQRPASLGPWAGNGVPGNARQETLSLRVDSGLRIENEEERILQQTRRTSVEGGGAGGPRDPPWQRTKMEWVMGSVVRDRDPAQLPPTHSRDSGHAPPGDGVLNPSPGHDQAQLDLEREPTPATLQQSEAGGQAVSHAHEQRDPDTDVDLSMQNGSRLRDSVLRPVANLTGPKLQSLGPFRPADSTTTWARLRHQARASPASPDKMVTLLVLDSPSLPADVTPKGHTVVLPVTSHNAPPRGCDSCVVVTKKMAAAITSYFSSLHLQENQTSLLAAILAAIQLVTTTKAAGMLVLHSGVRLSAQLEQFGLDPITSGVTYIGDPVFDAEEFFWGPETIAPVSPKSRHWFRLGDPGRVLVREAFPSYLPCLSRHLGEQNSADSVPGSVTPSSLTSKILSAVRGNLLPNSQTDGTGARRSASRLLDVTDRAFDPHAPSVFMARGSFSRLSLENALLHYDALWGLVTRCAVMTSPRPEVWGLWVQRLLWELNSTVMVTQPEVSASKPDGGEASFETLAIGRFWLGNSTTTNVTMQLLRSWVCEPKMSFIECMVSLASAMTRKALFSIQEYQLVASWTSALDELGYHFPQRRQTPPPSVGWRDRFHPSYVEFVPALIRTGSACQRARSLVEHLQSLGKQVRSAFVDPDPASRARQWRQQGERGNGTGSAGEETTSSVQGVTENGLDPLPISHLPSPYYGLCGQRGATSYSQEAGLNSDILLVVILSNKILYPNIAYLDFMYRRHFANVIYCADFDSELQANRHLLPRDISFVEASMELGFFQYNCTAQVLRMNYKIRGHLAVRDDLLLNPWHVASLPRDVPWWQPEVVFAKRTDPDVKIKQHRGDVWPEWRREFGTSSLSRVWSDFQKILQGADEDQKRFLAEFLDNLSRATGSELGVACETSDTFYLPDDLKREFLFLTEIFDRHRTYLEVAIPTMLTGLVGAENLYRMPGVYLWGRDRDLYRETFDPTLVFIHPVKMYKMEKDEKKMDFLCSVYLPLIEADLNNTAVGEAGESV